MTLRDVPVNRCIVAIDVGGTEVKSALVYGNPKDARPVLSQRRATPKLADPRATSAAVIDLVVELTEQLGRQSEHPLDALGLVVPGIVDDEAGVGVYSANLGWRDVPFGTILAERTGLPVAFGHDVRAGGLAEARLGAARGLSDAVIAPIGTGIAAAIMLGGRMHAGGGLAGELGHMNVGHELTCACGATGCLEVVASASAVARRYSTRSGRPVHGSAEVAEAMQRGDADAIKVWREAVEALTTATAMLATVLSPEAVIFGGGLAMARDLLLNPLRARLSETLTFQRMPDLRIAQLGSDAGCLGAALLAMDMLEERTPRHTRTMARGRLYPRTKPEPFRGTH
ncbi:ROK family protein [Pseudonocardiaceae bacterium YIM PH 21723]|nr:ROK family protein [Pseudonocardiaceae bacterium YIM PH 21723]